MTWLRVPDGLFVRLASVRPYQWVLAIDEGGRVMDPTQDYIRHTVPPLPYSGSLPMFEVSAVDLPDPWGAVVRALTELSDRLRAEALRRTGSPGELTALVRAREALGKGAFAHVGLVRSNLPLSLCCPESFEPGPGPGLELPDLG